MTISRQFDQSTTCIEANGGWIPDKITISGAPADYDHFNGDYSIDMISDGGCLLSLKFVKDVLQIVHDSSAKEWTIWHSGSSCAKCVSSKLVEDYQDLLSCTEGMWEIHIDSVWQAESTMKILDQWDVCMPLNGQRILSTISIEDAQVRSFWVDVLSPDGDYGSQWMREVNFNGEYTSIWNDNCGIAGELPSFYKDDEGNGYATLEIYYNTDEKKWFVRVLGPYLAWHDAAKCTASLGGAAYQDLSQCIAGKWESMECLDRMEPGGQNIRRDPTMKITSMVQNTAWQECLEWNPNTPRFSTRHVDTISIHFPESSSYTKDFTGVYKGSYEDTKNRQCDPNGRSMPQFKAKIVPADANLRILYQANQWILRTYDHDATTPGWVDIAKCTADVNERGWQDLRRCTEGTWEIHNSLYADPPGSSDYYPAPTMTIQAMYQSMSLNLISVLVDFTSSSQQWVNPGCPSSHSTGPPQETGSTESPDDDVPAGESEQSITVHLETTFIANFSGLLPRRRLGGESAECVAFMDVLFPGWPAKSAVIPDDVEVECIAVEILSDRAILKWDMISVNEAAMEKIETFVAEKVDESIEITISGETVTVTVGSTSRTGKESSPNEAESKPSEKGWLAENWWVLLVVGLGLIIIVLVMVFYRCRSEAAANAPEGNARVWVKEADKKGTAEDQEEKAALKGKEAKKEERGEESFGENGKSKGKGAEKKAKAKGGKKSKGKKGAKK